MHLNTLSTVDKRLLLGPINDPVIGIDIKTGEIVSIQKMDKLLVCNVNFGKSAITVVTNNLTVKEGMSSVCNPAANCIYASS